MPLIIALILLFSASFTTNPTKPGAILYFWKLRQGQWVTLRQKDICHHFDMGGQQVQMRLIRKTCVDKLNLLWITHNDQSHLRNIRKFKIPLCIAFAPSQLTGPASHLKRCPWPDSQIRVYQTQANNYAFAIGQHALLTGDSNQSHWPKINFRYYLAPQGGHSQYLHSKDKKLWICQPQFRHKKQVRNCLSTTDFGNIAIHLPLVN